MLGLVTRDSCQVLLKGQNPYHQATTYPGYLGNVPQKPGLVLGTIEASIALGVAPQEVDHRRLHEAIAAAHLSEVIDSLPDGVQANIGKRKNELSGGQLSKSVLPEPSVLERVYLYWMRPPVLLTASRNGRSSVL